MTGGHDHQSCQRPRGAKVAPKSLERNTRWRQERPKGRQKEHQMAPRGAQRRAKEHQMAPRGAQGRAKGTPDGAQRGPREGKRTPDGAKRGPREAQGSPLKKPAPSFAAILAENIEKHMVIATSRVTGGHARRVANQAQIKPSVMGGGLPDK